MISYVFQPHVRACVLENAAVFLDLRSGEYHGLDARPSRALSRLVRGWPQIGDDDICDGTPIQALATQLVSAGVLTQSQPGLPAYHPIRLPTARRRLYEPVDAGLPAIQISRLGRLAGACLDARLRLRCRSLLQLVEHVETRKQAHGPCLSVDLEAARRLNRSFMELRPFLYTAVDHCLADSLVLIEFLAAHHLFPTWVIGVKAHPFAAHSWVQLGRYVMNGAPASIRAYTPILAV